MTARGACAPAARCILPLGRTVTIHMVTTIRRSLIFRSLIFACGVACTLSAAAGAAERYQGTAYVRGTDHLAYRETDWLFMRDGVAQRLTLYRCTDGRPFARKQVHEAPNGISPDFEFQDARDGYREGVRTDGGARQIFVQQKAGAPTVVHPLPADSRGVIDAGFDAFIRAHWQDLAGGASTRIPFLVPARFKFLDFRIAGTSAGTVDGRPIRELKMTLAAWYGFALPSIELAYDAEGRRLEEYQGIGIIRDDSGHNQDVRIEFPSASRQDLVPDDEVNRAASEPLSSSCQG